MTTAVRLDDSFVQVMSAEHSCLRISSAAMLSHVYRGGTASTASHTRPELSGIGSRFFQCHTER